ncbi:MAG: hypothetical protein GAK35_02620 [Herbaspirillum frisingense]|uniref:Replication protein n=1 Tax=Herbaspirillum frisingense TaxID=92645 RepID=A0A7V8JTK8_9BURK|nr:MAG: hypothetical protein GAK35_02620 [Herbaspirillum frisingense]
MRDYGKVHTKFWSSNTIRSLSEDGRTLALYLLTCEHSTIAGVFRIPDGYVCEDIGWGIERVKQGFANLLEKGFANRCETSKWVWIHEHLKWNAPENPNQRKSARKIALTIPADTSWKPDFMRVCGEILEISTPSEGNPSRTVDEGFLNQKQEQKQEQKLTTPDGVVVASGAADPTKKPDCPHQDIIALYHEVLPMCPQVRDWTPARATQLRARWNEEPRRQNLGYWRSFFEYVAGCDFLVGKCKGDRPFMADLEWIVKSGNFTKIREGKYANS